MNRYHFTIASITLLLLSTPFAAFAAEPEAPGQGKPVPAVRVQTIAQQSIGSFYEGTGSIEAARVAQLASPAEGPIASCAVREGDAVKAGDVVVSLGRSKSTEAFLQSALADLKKEEQDAQSVEQLVNNGALPGEQRSIARANLQRARAQAAKLRESLEDFQIKAPWDGIVSRVLVREGNFVAPRMPLVEMYDPESLILRFSVPEAEAARVKNGMEVEFTLDAYKEQTFTAKVTRIFPELDRKTRALTLEAVPDAPVALKPGMFARLRLRLSQSSETPVAPARAVRISPNGDQYVLVVKDSSPGSAGQPQKGGQAGSNMTGESRSTAPAAGSAPGEKRSADIIALVEARPVRTGILAAEVVEIVDGLQAGDVIVVEGAEKAKSGARVRILPGSGKGAQ